MELWVDYPLNSCKKTNKEHEVQFNKATQKQHSWFAHVCVP